MNIFDSYSILFYQLQEVTKWLDFLKVPTLGSYFNGIIGAMEKAAASDKSQKLSTAEYLHFRKAAFEALLFIDVFKLLKDRELKTEILGKLKLATRLPDLDKESRKNSISRNHLFELHLASFIQRGGVNITGYDDIQFDFDGFNFHIECKRPSSINKIGQRIYEAYEKLKVTYIDEKSRGIIAISADKIIFPHSYLKYEEGDPNATLETFQMSTADERGFQRRHVLIR